MICHRQVENQKVDTSKSHFIALSFCLIDTLHDATIMLRCEEWIR